LDIDAGRRQFLRVSALAGGGLPLGIDWSSPRESAASTSAFRLNAWIGVHPDGRVSLVCPRNEMGQDVHTSLMMLLAEELAVDPRQVTVDEAPPDAVYINKLMGSQITGGQHEHSRCVGAAPESGGHSIANALFGLTGTRVRVLPLEDAGVTFV
jgi:CO/xanthine dehydrogenase Mo-binding subunit